MDDVDRLYRRLVHNARAAFPELLGRPFEVSQIYQHMVPYRTSRRDLGFAANDEYELALCQLLAGARGYLTGDPEMQRAILEELESVNPDLSVYRAYAASAVTFAPEPLREMMLRPATPDATLASDSRASPVEQAALAARPTEAVDTPIAAPPEAQEPIAEPAASEPPAPAGATPASPHASPLDSPMPVARPNPVRVAPGDSCRYCGTRLPEARSIVFCPGCGHNLTVKHCPACNTELEVGWKFCVTCGRDSAVG